MLKAEIFNTRWLTTNEVYLFLQYLPHIIESNLISLSYTPKIFPISKE